MDRNVPDGSTVRGRKIRNCQELKVFQKRSKILREKETFRKVPEFLFVRIFKN